MSDRHDAMRDLVPDLVTGALDPRDAAELEAHLRDCPTCAAERAQLSQVHAVLAEPVEDPPSWVRERVLAATWSEPLNGAPAAEPARAAKPRRSHRMRFAFAGLVAGVALAAAVGFLATRAEDAPAHSIPLEAGDAAPGASGRMDVGEAENGNIPIRLHLWGLKPPPTGVVYEVWLSEAKDVRISIGTVHAGPDGTCDVNLNAPEGAMQRARWVWITLETDTDPAWSDQMVVRASL